MPGLSRNIIIRCIMVVCVVMQVAVAMPHHHHEGSEAPCINYFHLTHHDVTEVGHDGCNGCCNSEHDHSGESAGACGSHRVILGQPERGTDNEDIALLIPDDCHCGFCSLADDFGKADLLASVVASNYQSRPYVASPLQSYIPVALPARAPNFIS